MATPAPVKKKRVGNNNELTFFPLAKMDEATHTVYGIAASETPDKDGEIFDYAFGKKAIQKWSEEFLARTTAAGQEPSLGNIRIMHGLTVGGKAVRIDFKDDEKQIWIQSQPVNDDVWQQLKRGILTGYSIGGGYAFQKQDGGHVRYGANVIEVSFVDNPCNPDAGFAYVKADGSMELRKFAPHDSNKVISDAATEAANKAAEFANALDKARVPNGQFTAQGSGEAHDFLVSSGYSHERVGTSMQHGVGVATQIATYKNGNAMVTIHEDGRWEHDNGHQVRTTGVGLQDLKSHLELCMAAKTEKVPVQERDQFAFAKSDWTLDEAKEFMAGVETAEQAPYAFTEEEGQFVFKALTVGDVLKGDGLSTEEEEALDEDMGLEDNEDELGKGDESKKPYGDVHYADPGYQEDKKKRYPLDTEEHIRAAWNYIHQEKNAKQYSSEQVAHIRSAIVAAWKDKIDTDGPPSANKHEGDTMDKTVGEVLELRKARVERLRKSMYDVGVLANVLMTLRDLVSSSWYEAAFENISEGGGDEADLKICEALHEHLTGLVDVLKEMVDEETEELLATPALKTAVNQTTEGVQPSMKHVEELVKAAKGLAGHFKAAAAHHLKKAEHHEAAAGTHTAMAECHKAAHEHHKSAQATELAKGMASHHAEMHKLHKAMAGHHTSLHKMHKAHSDHCAAMGSQMEDGAEKTTTLAGEDSVQLTKSVEDLSKAFATGLEAFQTGVAGIGEVVKTTVTATLQEQLVKDESGMVKTAGLSLVPRPGEVIKTQDTTGVSDNESGL
jgi:hypothetical protein